MELRFSCSAAISRRERRTTATDPIKADGKTRALIVKWGRLHLVRTALGALGTIALLYALAAD
jgi:hypothetical protein